MSLFWTLRFFYNSKILKTKSRKSLSIYDYDYKFVCVEFDASVFVVSVWYWLLWLQSGAKISTRWFLIFIL